MGKLRSKWDAAKNDAEKKFPVAYKNWVNKLKLDLKSKDENTKGKAQDALNKEMLKNLADLLGDSGLGKGYRFTDYFVFSEGFGPSLDKLEKVAASYKPRLDELNDQSMEGFIKNANLSKLFVKFLGSDGLGWQFYAKDYKLAPAKVFDKYIAKNTLKLPSTLTKKWTEAKQNGFKGGPALVKETRDALVDHIQDQIEAFNKSEAVMKYGGFQDWETARDKSRAVAMSYARQVAPYRKRWAALQPDFCTPCLKALNEILGEIDKLDEPFKKTKKDLESGVVEI